MVFSRFHFSVFVQRAWYKNGDVCHCFVFVRFHFLCSDISFAFLFGTKSVVVVVAVVVVAFSNDSVFDVSIENDAFSNVSVFKSLHFEQLFHMSPFSIVSNGNSNSNLETFHSCFHTGNGA